MARGLAASQLALNSVADSRNVGGNPCEDRPRLIDLSLPEMIGGQTPEGRFACVQASQLFKLLVMEQGFPIGLLTRVKRTMMLENTCLITESRLVHLDQMMKSQVRLGAILRFMTSTSVVHTEKSSKDQRLPGCSSRNIEDSGARGACPWLTVVAYGSLPISRHSRIGTETGLLHARCPIPERAWG